MQWKAYPRRSTGPSFTSPPALLPLGRRRPKAGVEAECPEECLLRVDDEATVDGTHVGPHVQAVARLQVEHTRLVDAVVGVDSPPPPEDRSLFYSRVHDIRIKSQ